MRRVAAHCLSLGSTFILAACLPSLPALVPPTPLPATPFIELNPSPQATATLVAMPSVGAAPTVLVDTSGTFTPIASFTATQPGFIASLTPVLITLEPTQPTVTPTFAESISLDKLPASTVYKHVRIENQSHSQMDISLHCTTIKGLHTVLEYENVRNLSVQAPEGDYIYVVYVGGRRMSGSFSLLSVPGATITVYADRVVVH